MDYLNFTRIFFAISFFVVTILAGCNSDFSSATYNDQDTEESFASSRSVINQSHIIDSSKIVIPPTVPARPKFVAQNKLSSIAANNGSVRVILRLDVPHTPPGLLNAADQANQKAGIANAQDAVITGMQNHAVKGVKKFASIPFMAMQVDSAGLDALYNNPQVTGVFEDKLNKPSLAETAQVMRTSEVYQSGFDGSGWTVAVLDTGVDSAHPFLSGKVVSEACYSTTYAPHFATSLCPNGLDSQIGAGSGVHCPYNSLGCYHGTHVAGIAAGADPGGVGYNGVAKGASIVAIQVFSHFNDLWPCWPYGSCILSYDSDVILGLERVLWLQQNTTLKIAAVNMSLGGWSYSDQALCDADNAAHVTAFNNLRSVGIAPVVAAGNGSQINAVGSPGCVSSAISVTASYDWRKTSLFRNLSPLPSDHCYNTFDCIANFSNVANFVDLVAPGSPIASSMPGGLYAQLQGTSMATPAVAGAWAVAKQKTPTATVTDTLNLFRSTGVTMDDTRDQATVTGLKRIDLAAAFGTPRPVLGPTSIIGPSGIIDVIAPTFSWNSVAGATKYTIVWTDLSGFDHSLLAVTPTGAGCFGGGICSIIKSNWDPNTIYNWRVRADIDYIDGLWSTISVFRNLASPAKADFNSDGKPDLVWRNSVTGQNIIWYMDGVTRLSGDWLTTVANTSWQIAATGDFNGDGRPDLVWRNYATGANVVWYMDGATRLSFESILTVADTNWEIVGSDDFNGDGKPDLVWRNFITGQNIIWNMDGVTRLSGDWLTTVANISWKIVGTGDFNSDGKPDLVWRNYSNGANVVWYMDGTTRLSYDWILTVANISWLIVATGDFNGDGKPDLVWRNYATGQNVVWYMDGTTRLSYESLLTVADTNWEIVN